MIGSVRGSPTPKELAFIRSRDTVRIATVGPKGWPHCVPVGYLYRNRRLYIPAGKTSKKVRNLRLDNRACLVIDDEKRSSGVLLLGLVEIIEDERFLSLKRWMNSVTGWTVGEPGETVMLQVRPIGFVSWMLNA